MTRVAGISLGGWGRVFDAPDLCSVGTPGISFYHIFCAVTILNDSVRSDHGRELLPWVGLESLEPRWMFAADYALIDIGTLGGPSSAALDLNASLEVVGRSMTDPSPASTRAFSRRLAGPIVDLGTLGGFDRSGATGINNTGIIVGTALNSTFDERAFIQPISVPMVELGTLGGSWSRATAINNAGQIVGSSAVGSAPGGGDQFHAFIWESGQINDLGTLGGSISLARSISQAGHVVGVSTVPDEQAFRAFVWQDGVMTGLETLGGPAGSANGVNRDGIVVGDTDLRRKDENGFRQFRAVMWQDEQITDLGTLGGKFSSATAVNDDGIIVGWSQIKAKNALGNRIEHAFLYDDGTMRDLNDLIDDDLWTLMRATAVNSDGYIVGYGSVQSSDSSQTQTRAFMLRPLYSDLRVDIERTTLENQIVPGDRGRVRLQVGNQGENDARGRVTLEIYMVANNDTTEGRGVLIGQKTCRRIRLEPGEAKTFSVNVEMPSFLAPGNYQLRATVVGDDDIVESDTTNNTALDSQSRQLLWQFGRFDGRHGVRLTITEAQGYTLKFAMRGQGTGQVRQTPEGLDVEISGSNHRTSVRVSNMNRDDEAFVADVTLTGSLNRFKADDIDLRGAFISSAAVNQVIFDDVASSDGIVIGDDANPRNEVSFTFSRVVDLTINSAIDIDKIKASDWVDTDGTPDAIIAPALGRLSIDGDFAAGLQLSGSSVEPNDLTLGKVQVSGTITGGTWSVVGQVSRIKAGAINETWNAQFIGDVKRIKVDQDMAGFLIASSIGLLEVGRNLHDAELRLGPVTRGTDGTFVLDRLRVGQRMERVNLFSHGNLGDMSTGTAEDVNVFGGIADPTDQLPQQVGDFDTLAVIRSLKIRGLRHQANSAVNVNVSAWSIGSIDVARAGTLPASTPDQYALGIAAHEVGSLTYRSDQGAMRLRRADDFVAVARDDLLIRLV